MELNKPKSCRTIMFRHSNDLIGSEVCFLKKRSGKMESPSGFTTGSVPHGMGAVLYYHVVSHNAKRNGTVVAVRVYHTASQSVTFSNLQYVLEMDSSEFVLSVACKYESVIMNSLPKGSSLHKLLGVSMYFCPSRSIFSVPPPYEAQMYQMTKITNHK